jgi:hypothetical protein
MGYLVGAASLAVIALVVALAICAEWWPRLGRWFAEPKRLDDIEAWPEAKSHQVHGHGCDGHGYEMSGNWKDEHEIGWRR